MPDAPPQRALAFAPEEYAIRLESLREAMALQELDALVLTEPANIAWATGYDAVSVEAPMAAILSMADGPRWWGAERDRAGAAATVWMAEERLAAYAEIDGRHPFADLAAKLGDWGLGKARIGVELDSPYFTAAAIGQLLSELSGARYVDATGLADWRRIVKSETEIALMRRAAAEADAAHERALAALRPGASTRDVLAEIASTLAGGAPAVAPSLLSGAEIAARSLAASDRALDANAPHAVILAGSAERYCCPVARTIHLGEPPNALTDAATRAADAFDAATAAAKPGATAAAVAEAFAAELGGAVDGPIGFSVGLARPPRWRERNLRIVAGETTELLEGMTLWLTAGPHALGAPLRVDETVLLGASGAEALAKTPRELAVKR